MRARLSALLAVLLAGCGAEPAPKEPAPTPSAIAARPPPPPPPASSTPPASPRPPAVCFDAGRASQEIRSFRRDGAKAVLCLGDDEKTGPVACLALDPASSTFSKADEPKETAGAAPAFSVATRGEVLHVCAKGEAMPCKRTLRPGFSPVRGDVKDYAAAVSPDGTRVFVIRHVIGKGSHEVFGDLHDLAKKKRLSSTSLFVPAKPQLFGDLSDLWSASFVGPRLHVSARRCCGPDGADAILDPAKGTLVSIGDPALFLVLGDDLLLVGNEDRMRDEDESSPFHLSLTLFDLQAGKATRKDLRGRRRDAPETGVISAVTLDDGVVLVAHANPPGFVRFDPKTRAFSEELAAPLCPR